jgi:anti-sigma-K factor RskA
MSENFDRMEMLLRGLKPVAPNPEVQERVAADLKLDEAWLPRQVRRAPRWMVASGWASLGAAAAVVALAFLTQDSEPKGKGGAEASNLVQTLETPRAVSNPAALPVRVWSVERRAWIDPADGAEIMVEIPKTDAGKTVLPVNFQ